MMKIATVSMIAAALFTTKVGSSASAAQIDVFPTDTFWTTLPGENTGTGTSGVQFTPLLDGDGAVFIKGDRTRFAAGTIYPNSASTSFGLLSALTAYDDKWTTVTRDLTGVQLAQAPALRLHVFDPSQGASGRRLEIIWEDGEQGSNSQFSGNATALPGSTFTGNMFNSGVYVNTGGFGRGLYDNSGNLIADTTAPMSLSALKALLGSNTFVAGLSLGVGSSVGAAYTGYADDVHIAFGPANDTLYNFTTIPEPTTLALFGLGAIGLLARRRRTVVA